MVMIPSSVVVAATLPEGADNDVEDQGRPKEKVLDGSKDQNTTGRDVNTSNNAANCLL